MLCKYLETVLERCDFVRRGVRAWISGHRELKRRRPNHVIFMLAVFLMLIDEACANECMLAEFLLPTRKPPPFRAAPFPDKEESSTPADPSSPVYT